MATIDEYIYESNHTGEELDDAVDKVNGEGAYTNQVLKKKADGTTGWAYLTTDYDELTDKPTINGVELNSSLDGDNTLEDLGIAPISADVRLFDGIIDGEITISEGSANIPSSALYKILYSTSNGCFVASYANNYYISWTVDGNHDRDSEYYNIVGKALNSVFIDSDKYSKSKIDTLLSSKAGVDVATTSANGLMSSSDKAKLDSYCYNTRIVIGKAIRLKVGNIYYKKKGNWAAYTFIKEKGLFAPGSYVTMRYTYDGTNYNYFKVDKTVTDGVQFTPNSLIEIPMTGKYTVCAATLKKNSDVGTRRYYIDLKIEECHSVRQENSTSPFLSVIDDEIRCNATVGRVRGLGEKGIRIYFLSREKLRHSARVSASREYIYHSIERGGVRVYENLYKERAQIAREYLSDKTNRVLVQRRVRNRFIGDSQRGIYRAFAGFIKE